MSDSQVTTTSNQTPSTTGNSRGDERDTRAIRPFVDVVEDDTGITLLADLPGVPRDQLELKVEGDTLQIEGRVAQATPEGLEATYAEVQVPRYRRAFRLGKEFNVEQIDANLKDGVLKLRIPKHAHAQPRRISIRAS